MKILVVFFVLFSILQLHITKHAVSMNSSFTRITFFAHKGLYILLKHLEVHYNHCIL